MDTFKEYLKELVGGRSSNPQDALEEADFSRLLVESIMPHTGFIIPDKDKDKYIVVDKNILFYPPKEYYRKELTEAALITLLRNHKLVPITIGNIHVFQTWENAKEEWGYAVLWSHLHSTYGIILTLERGENEGL